jgi:hypothetical protein
MIKLEIGNIYTKERKHFHILLVPIQVIIH